MPVDPVAPVAPTPKRNGAVGQKLLSQLSTRPRKAVSDLQSFDVIRQYRLLVEMVWRLVSLTP
jgi:hypothetical protein